GADAVYQILVRFETRRRRRAGCVALGPGVLALHFARHRALPDDACAGCRLPPAADARLSTSGSASSRTTMPSSEAVGARYWRMTAGSCPGTMNLGAEASSSSRRHPSTIAVTSATTGNGLSSSRLAE